MEHLYENVPDIGLKLQKEEEIFQQYLQTESKRYESYPASSTPSSNYSKIIIPVIFSVVHFGNDPVYQRATKEMIIGNLKVVNEIFAENPLPYKGELKVIQFCRVTKKADGSPFPPGEEGILWLENQALAGEQPYGFQIFQDILGAAFADYPREKYCRIAFANFQGTLLGGAYLPSLNSFYINPNWVANLDGVILDYAALGDETQTGNYNRGGILAHELGHWLNLHHPFDGACGAIAAQQNNQYYTPLTPNPLDPLYPYWPWVMWDFVTDTPPKSRNWSEYTGAQPTCSGHVNAPPAVQCSGFTYPSGSLQDLVYNTMDYAQDECRLLFKNKAFTPKQRERISYSLQYYRPVLFSPQNLIFTGVACQEPQAIGQVSRVFVCGEDAQNLNEVTITPLDIPGAINPQISWTASESFSSQTLERISPTGGNPTSFGPATFKFNTQNQREVTITQTITGSFVPPGSPSGTNPVLLNVSVNHRFFIHPSCNAGQVEKSNLVFGQNAAITSSPAPLAIQNPNATVFESTETGKINTTGGSVTYTDKGGNLVYYAAGDKLWNASHQEVFTGLSSKNGSNQYGIIMDKPGEAYAHYLFTVPKHGSQQYADMGLRVHTIKYYDFPSSTIVQPLPAPPGAPTAGTDFSAKVSEKITIVPGCQAGESWLIVQGPVEDATWGTRFYVYKISSTGSITFDHYDDAMNASQTGYLKANPSGEMLVCTYSNVDQTRGYGIGSEARLFTFNRSIGKIEPFKRLVVPGLTNLASFGASFNGNGSYVYVNVNREDETVGGIITQRAGIYKWDLRNVSTSGGTLNGSLVDLIPYGVSPSQDLLLDGNERILLSNTLDPKIIREALGRYFVTPNPPPGASADYWNNLAYPLSGRQLGILYCPENSNPGLSWYGTNLHTATVVEDPSSQNYIMTKGGLGNFVDAKELSTTQTTGLTQGNPKVVSPPGAVCCPYYDAVNVACTGNDDAAHGNDIYYSFKVTRPNTTVAFKELRLSTGECDFTGTYILEFLNNANDWIPVPNSYEESLGNGKYWRIEGEPLTLDFQVPNPLERVFRLSMNANSPSASGFFKLRMAYGVFTLPYFEFTGASCCRMALDGLVKEELKGEETKPFSIYPNPGKGRFSVEGLEEGQDYFITDMSGRKVMQGHVKADLLEANALAPGVYQLRFPQRPDLKHVKLVIQP